MGEKARCHYSAMRLEVYKLRCIHKSMGQITGRLVQFTIWRGHLCLQASTKIYKMNDGCNSSIFTPISWCKCNLCTG